MRLVRAIIGSLLVVAGQTTSNYAQEPPESVAKFVRTFYDWYVPLANSLQRTAPSNLVLEQRAGILDSQLLHGLVDDSAAQARAPGEIVGLDFDPFLAAQDPCERYEVGRATRRGRSYWVDIFAVCDGKRDKRPDVVAEVLGTKRSWVFVNFRYPKERSDLLTVLRRLRRNRQR